MIVATDHVLLALEKMGHKDLSEHLQQLERDLASCGFLLEKRLTVNTEKLTLGLSIKPIPEDDEDRSPLWFSRPENQP